MTLHAVAFCFSLWNLSFEVLLITSFGHMHHNTAIIRINPLHCSSVLHYPADLEGPLCRRDISGGSGLLSLLGFHYWVWQLHSAWESDGNTSWREVRRSMCLFHTMLLPSRTTQNETGPVCCSRRRLGITYSSGFADSCPLSPLLLYGGVVQ